MRERRRVSERALSVRAEVHWHEDLGDGVGHGHSPVITSWTRIVGLQRKDRYLSVHRADQRPPLRVRARSFSPPLDGRQTFALSGIVHSAPWLFPMRRGHAGHLPLA